MNQIYLDTARLLTQVAPLVITDGTFALKGGTAINLFIRDMPRLSVDLDLVFPDYSLPRDQTLARIGDAILKAVAAGLSVDPKSLPQPDDGRDDMRALIDAWWPLIERGEVAEDALQRQELRVGLGGHGYSAIDCSAVSTTERRFLR